MTYISIQPTSMVDTNNTINNTLTGTYTGTSKQTQDYITLILSISSTQYSTTNGIQIYLYDENETPTIYYVDSFNSNTITYNKTFILTKQYYYVKFIPQNEATEYSLTLTSKLSNVEINNANNPDIFDYNYENSIDAFGKQRVTTPLTLLDIKFIGQINGADGFLKNELIICNDISGSFNSTVNTDSGYLEISGTGDGHYISQSRIHNTYQPGKSLLLMFSGILIPTDINNNYINSYINRLGYYSNNLIYNSDKTLPYNGFYFQYDSTGTSINLSNKGTITKIAQTTWNLDTLDGNGHSKINLDFKKAQLFTIDLEWLSVGRIRFGFFIYGKCQYCHQITNINLLTSPYISNINLPVRYELIGTDNLETTQVSTKQICTSVISEGGYNPRGKPFSFNSGLISFTTSETPIVAFRGGGSNYYHQEIIPNNINIVDTDKNNTCIWKLRLYMDNNTTNAGVNSWTDVNSNYSVSQFSTDFNAWSETTSIVISEGIFSGKANVSYNSFKDTVSPKILQITSNIDNISDIMVITCQILSGNSSQVICSCLLDEYY